MDLVLFKEICDLFKKKETITEFDYVELNGIKFSYEEFDELQIEDEGKYQYGGTIYSIGILDEEKGYGIKDTLFYIRQDFIRSGSYFSDYYYEYEEPYIVKRRQVISFEWRAV